ncbi:MAG: protein phosphatase CheZ [Alphaproteobacteria bacterium]
MPEQKDDFVAGQYSRDQVVNIINSVIAKVKNPQEVSYETICLELHSLKSAIDDMRGQLRNSLPRDIGAKDELEAAIGETEKATHAIMDSCERIRAKVAGAGPETAMAIETEITGIYEACTFQDIVGQRITKVIKTFKKVDESISAIVHALDGNAPYPGEAPKEKKPDYSKGEGLMNGPALPQNAMSQDDIDKLLSSFDD